MVEKTWYLIVRTCVISSKVSVTLPVSLNSISILSSNEKSIPFSVTGFEQKISNNFPGKFQLAFTYAEA